IGEEFWRSRFGADQGIIGRSINLGGTQYEVIGVLPAGVRFPPSLSSTPPDVWTPLTFGANVRTQRGNRSLNAIARMKPGMAIEAAASDVKRVADAFKAENVANYPQRSGFEPSVSSVVGDITGSVKGTLIVFMGAVAFVLLVGCANLANLLLVRATTRN